jgi:hypothetical protein
VTHTRARTLLDSSGRSIGPSKRPLPDHLIPSQKTVSHAPGRIRTHLPSKLEVADPRLRSRSHRDRLILFHILYIVECNKMMIGGLVSLGTGSSCQFKNVLVSSQESKNKLSHTFSMLIWMVGCDSLYQRFRLRRHRVLPPGDSR